MQAHHVSSFEGGRAYAVVFIWAPLGFLVGCVTGFAVGMFVRARGFSGYLIKQAVALLAIALIVLAVGGLGYATADHPPLIDGKNLALEIEVRVPAKGRSIEQLQAEDFTVALVVSASDRNYADLRWSESREADGFITVRAWSQLRSRNAGREITAGVRDENRQIFNVMLRASPAQVDESWTDWAPPRERFDGSKPLPEDQYTVRYRVRFSDEYLPTPAPETPDSSDLPASEESPTEAEPDGQS